MVMLTIATCSVAPLILGIFTFLVRVLKSGIQTSEAFFERLMFVIFHKFLPEYKYLDRN